MFKRKGVNENDNVFFAQTHEVQEAMVSTQRQIKGSFIERERFQANSYIKDLEASIAINKGIVADLLKKTDVDNGKMVAKMNDENKMLLNQVKRAVKQRNEAQARLLITEQMFEEQKKKEKSVAKEYEEKEMEWIDQLNRKEYVLQIYQKIISQAIISLRAHGTSNPTIIRVIDQLGANVSDSGRIANVVAEKEDLERKLKEEMHKTQALKKEVTELRRMAKENSAPKGANENRVPLSQVTNIVLNQKATARELQLQKEVAQLYKLNKELSNALAKMTRASKAHRRATSDAHRCSNPFGNPTKTDKARSKETTVICDFKPEPDLSFGDL